MKVLRLNRRWRQFKEHGHTVCFRFDVYNKEAGRIEAALRELTNKGGWERQGDWYGYYAKSWNVYNTRPYFITLRDENLVSMVLLKSGVQHETSSL